MSSNKLAPNLPKQKELYNPKHPSRVWFLLTNPGPAYLDPDEHRRAKLLATILIVLFPVIILVGIVFMPALNLAQGIIASPTFLPALAASILSVISYILNRSGKFRSAALIYTFMFCTAPLLAVYTDLGPVNVAIGALAIGGVILASILLPQIQYSYLAAILVVVGTALAPVFNPRFTFTHIVALLSANLTNSILIIFYSIYRNQIETESQSSLKSFNIQLSASYEDTLEGWSRALEFKDKFAVGHAERVTHLTLKMARTGGIESDQLLHIYRGALLHDIGKIGIPDYILFKTERLNDDEMNIVRLHPIWAYEMLEPIPFLRPALPIPYSHHEKWNGSGYPQGLAGEEIPFAVRLFSVADVYDALLSDRPYRKAWEQDKVEEYLRVQSGTHFDPECVDIFFEVAYPRAPNKQP